MEEEVIRFRNKNILGMYANELLGINPPSMDMDKIDEPIKEQNEVQNQYMYSYSFAELCDRLQIVTLKMIASKDPNENLGKEQNEILHDIQLHLDQKPMNAEMIKAFTVLTLTNKFIFDNEAVVRGDKAEELDDLTHYNMLKDSHKANSLRAASKKYIQNQRGERIDPKLNYGQEDGFWNIKY